MQIPAEVSGAAGGHLARTIPVCSDVICLLSFRPHDWERSVMATMTVIEHTGSKGVWLTLAKKGTTKPTSVTWQQAIEEAMCIGWIYGQSRKQDEATYTHRFQPRTKKSMWWLICRHCRAS